MSGNGRECVWGLSHNGKNRSMELLCGSFVRNMSSKENDQSLTSRGRNLLKGYGEKEKSQRYV